MTGIRRKVALLLLSCAVTGSATAQSASSAQQIQSYLQTAKQAAGTDFPGVLSTICVAAVGPNARGPRPPGARQIPDRSTWYARPYKAFDNLYFVGTKVHSSWALTTSAGIILIDTLFNYAVEPEIIDGLKTLGLDPAAIKYVIISHGHGDHDEGAKLLQDRYGAKIVMGGADWDAVEKMQNKPGGIPRRDIVGTDGQKITLGDTTVTLVHTPGHTPGTLSSIFQVKDKGRTLTVAYSGGTAFNFPQDKAHFDDYAATQRKMAAAAAAAGASVLMSNHSEFDGAYQKVRLAQLPRQAGEPHPYEVGVDGVARYFKLTESCARAAALQVASQ